MSEAAVDPVIVEYCPTCSFPREYCEFGDVGGCGAPPPGSGEDAAAAAAEGVEKLGLEGAGERAEGAAAAAAAASDAAPAAPAPEKQKSGKNKKAKKQEVVIERTTRNKRKCVTTISGLDIFQVKLAEAAKKFGKKFACGSSVVKDAAGKEQIDVQGDFMEEIGELILKEYGKDGGISEDVIKYVDKGK
mmetsp:Transcript_16720/g.54651  ORF Transcript_16720/g.54651 Transcript_16720/m.54651 type:complete len:189 (-) Transcript_16720:1351-1917(-)